MMYLCITSPLQSSNSSLFILIRPEVKIVSQSPYITCYKTITTNAYFPMTYYHILTQDPKVREANVTVTSLKAPAMLLLPILGN